MRNLFPKRIALRLLIVVAYTAVANIGNAEEAFIFNTDKIIHGVAPINRQEPVSVTGVIKDGSGNPLFGVKVSIEGKTSRIFSDKKGVYKISAEIGESIVFTLSGFVEQKLTITSEVLNIILEESEALAKQEVISILYRTKSAETRLQSTSMVYTKDLMKVPVAGVNNALSGRLAGLYTLQSSGRPGDDLTSISIRGNSPLILVNGVPRNYASVDPEQIESVTLLKDGLSTVMFGQQSANSIMLIKTRSGEVGKQHISVTAQTGLQSAIKLPKPLQAFDYATLYNEALANDGKAARFSAADLDAYKNGSDSFGHPNVDWYNTILKPNTPFSRYNINVYGGGNSTKYFVDADYLQQSGIFVQDPRNSYSTNSDFKRYLVRTNIDIDITPSTFLNINLFGRIQSGNEPGGRVVNNSSNTGTGGIFSQLATTPNLAYPVFNPDNSLGGSSDYQSNIWAGIVRSGYFFVSNRDVSADISLKKTLNNITNGLWVKGLASFNTSVSEFIHRTKSYAVYKYIPGSPVSYQKYGLDGQQGNTTSNLSQGRNLFIDFSAGLDKSIRNNNWSVLFKYNRQSQQQGSDIPSVFDNTALRLQYNYAEKYLAEAAVSYSGLNRYVEGKRYGLFYGFGLGWNLKKEDFLKNTAWLNMLKLRTNFAYTANANAGYFRYNQYYGGGASYMFGTTPTTLSGIAEGALANPNITWEKAYQFNAGIDVALFNYRLTFAADYFNNRYFDLMQVRGRNSALLGASFPSENIGISNYSGLEFEIKYSGQLGKLNYYIAPNVFSLQKIIKFQDEIDRPYTWMRRTGQREDQTFGYVADGLFQSAAEIASSAKIQGYNPVPGDIKYKDLNSDGIINELDIKALKNNKPIWFYGVNMGLSYEGLDVSILLQGVQNRYVYVSGSSEWAFQNNGLGQAFEQNLGRWTAATASTATHPRLSIGANPNNEVGSSFWLHNGSYLRIKNAEIGYTIPKKMSDRLSLSSARIFFNGVNLFTAAAYSRVDPEVYGTSYPLQKVINIGINIKF